MYPNPENPNSGRRFGTGRGESIGTSHTEVLMDGSEIKDAFRKASAFCAVVGDSEGAERFERVWQELHAVDVAHPHLVGFQWGIRKNGGHRNRGWEGKKIHARWLEAARDREHQREVERLSAEIERLAIMDQLRSHG